MKTSDNPLSTGQSFYVLRLSLTDLPQIWRLVQVPAHIPLHKLHQVFQDAMGWQDVHLYEFQVTENRYGLPDPDYSDGLSDARKIVLQDVMGPKQKALSYLYDFGDHWEHTARLEQIIPDQAGTLYPVCIAGQGACPPEDCGGITGYLELIKVLRNPAHPEYPEIVTWLDGHFDPEIFDWGQTNARLRRIKVK